PQGVRHDLCAGPGVVRGAAGARRLGAASRRSRGARRGAARAMGALARDRRPGSGAGDGRLTMKDRTAGRQENAMTKGYESVTSDELRPAPKPTPEPESALARAPLTERELFNPTETIIGNDDRMEIPNTTDMPWRYVCSLRIKMPNGL